MNTFEAYPGIEDPELFQEFRDALYDYAPRVEAQVAELRREPDNPTAIANLFRSFHTIKGDAGLSRVNFIVPLVDETEMVLGRLRGREIHFTDLLGEVMLLTLDRLEVAVDNVEVGKSLEPLRLGELEAGLAALGRASMHQLDEVCTRLLEAVTGYRPVVVDAVYTHVDTEEGRESSRDLHFFRTLAQQLEQHSPLFAGRTLRNLRLALATNHEAGCPVDVLQLEAAVYMHDIGMAMLPSSLWLKVGRLMPDERVQMADHPLWAAGLLERMHGWAEAARIVRQHHEKPDGTGYPNCLSSVDICDGAKILAIVDAFEAVMLKHSHRGQRRSILRAIAEINASDYQFDPAWIAAFNRVVRHLIEQGEGQALARLGEE